MRQTGRWVEEVAAGDAGKVVVGFGVEDLPDFSTAEEISQGWTRIQGAHPSIRGAFLWQHRTDADRGWPFARLVAPAVTSGRAERAQLLSGPAETLDDANDPALQGGPGRSSVTGQTEGQPPSVHDTRVDLVRVSC